MGKLNCGLVEGPHYLSFKCSQNMILFSGGAYVRNSLFCLLSKGIFSTFSKYIVHLMFVVQGWKKSLKNLEVCNGFFSAILTHYYYVYLLPLDLLLLLVVGFFFFLLTCVCRVGLNLPHKTEKKQNPNCKP